MAANQKRLLRRIAMPLALALTGLVTLLLAGGFSTLVAKTNSTDFCISCHEMEATVYKEYRESIHYSNTSGVRAECADCHVPKQFGPKMLRKVMAARDVYHTLLGTMDTPEKFESHRLQLAERVWDYMEKSDSRECRSCHSFEAMDFKHQSDRASRKMQKAMERGKTCIECHKGIAHSLPEVYDDEA